MLIKNSQERTARHHEKMMIALRYLAREHYSDFATLKRVFGFKNHRGLYDLLNKLERDGAIKKEHVGIDAKPIFDLPAIRSLWRITAAGCAYVYPERTPPHRECVSLSSHAQRQHITEQNVRLSFEALGACDWIDGRNAPFPTRHKHHPSAVFTWHNGHRYAVEVMTTFKTPLRYREIVKKHLLAQADEEWLIVYFVAPSEAKRTP